MNTICETKSLLTGRICLRERPHSYKSSHLDFRFSILVLSDVETNSAGRNETPILLQVSSAHDRAIIISASPPPPPQLFNKINICLQATASGNDESKLATKFEVSGNEIRPWHAKFVQLRH